MVVDCIRLLPQNEDSFVRCAEDKVRILKSVRFFLINAIEAFEEFFIKKHFFMFDPHVGETSCQIRAHKVLILASKITDEDVIHYAQKNKQLHKILCDLENLSPIHCSQKNRELLKDFLKKLNCLFDVSDDELFLVRAYLLSKYKSEKNHNKTDIDYLKLCQDIGLTRKFSKKMIHKYQLTLSQHSCDYVVNLAKSISIYDQMWMLEQLRMFDDDGRHVLPSYGFMRILLSHLRLSQYSVLLISERFVADELMDTVPLLYKVKDNSFSLKSQLNDIDLSQPCFVIRGSVNYQSQTESKLAYIERISQYTLDDILLTNIASHPQYSGKKLAIFRENPYTLLKKCFDQFVLNASKYEEEFRAMQKKAFAIGCCLENASLFFVKHVFCDSVKNQLEKIGSA